MSVRKRETQNGPRWFVDIFLPNGTRFRKTVGTKREAEEVHRRMTAEIVQGEWGIRETKDITFRALAKEYLEYAEANKAPKTYSVDKSRINGHLVPYFGNTPVKRITPLMIDRYKRMRGKHVTASTVNHELTNLSHMFKMAIRWQYLDRNIITSEDKMKVPKRAVRFLSQDEICRFLEAARDSHIYALVVTAIHTGMRKGELFNLTWADINFDKRMVTIQPKDDWSTKNYKSRTIMLTPDLYDVLRKHRIQHLEMGIRSEYVFTYNGERLRSNIKKSFARVIRMAGLKNVTLHTLRHTFASQLVMAGASLRKVQELMGHQSFETTLQYVHLEEDHAKNIVLKLPFANTAGKAMARVWHAEGDSVDIPKK
ncbi:tyrosine-type recombinase/integrase [Candidatus Poribacteria bacterium]